MFKFDNGLAKYLSASLALSIVILTPISFLGLRALLTSGLQAVTSLIIHMREINGEKSRELRFFLPSFVSWQKDELNCLIKTDTSILACIVSKPFLSAKYLAPQTPEICWSLKIWKLYDTDRAIMGALI